MSTTKGQLEKDLVLPVQLTLLQSKEEYLYFSWPSSLWQADLTLQKHAV